MLGRIPADGLAGGGAGASSKVAAHVWYATSLLCLLYMVAFIDRFVMSLLVGPIRSELMISDTQMSLLLGTSFAAFYAVFGLPMARIADNGNRRNLIVAAVSVWSITTALSGLAQDFHVLLACRIGVALGEAALTPAALSMIADLFPPQQRTRGASLYLATGLIGAMGAFILGGTVLRAINGFSAIAVPGFGDLGPWRLVFLLVGAPGLILAMLLAVTVREPERHGESAPEPIAWRETLDFLRRSWRSYFFLFVGVALSQFTCHALIAWYPTVLIRQYGMTAQDTGWLFGGVGLIGCVSGGLIVPRLADAWERSGRGGLMKVLVVATLISVAFAVAYPVAPSMSMSLGLVAVTLFLLIGVGVTPIVAVQTLAPNRYRGQLSACFMLINNLGGYATAPTIVAVLSDRVFHGPGSLGFGLATLSACTLPLATVMLLLGLRMVRPASVSQVQAA